MFAWLVTLWHSRQRTHHQICFRQLGDRGVAFDYYSLACNESTNASDATQQVICLSGVDDDMNVIEELLDLQSLKHDITKHLNALNVSLQGQDAVVSQLYAHIKAFGTKLQFFQRQFAKRTVHCTFPSFARGH